MKTMEEKKLLHDNYLENIPSWIFVVNSSRNSDDTQTSELDSPKETQTNIEASCSTEKVIYKTPKSRVTNVTPTISIEIETTPKKIRETPLPNLNWADREDVWQNMVYKEEAMLSLRSYKLFENRSYLPRMRSILLDWIMEVCEVYRLRRNTYYFAVDYIDRYLSLKPQIPKTQVQLLGVACLFIAAKLEEIYPPKLSEFSYVCDGACTEDEILQCEVLLLNTLTWEVNPVTPTAWLNLYMQIHHSDEEARKHKKIANIEKNFNYPQYSGYQFVRASHIMDLFSLDPGFIKFSYSVTAAAAMYFVYGKSVALAVSRLKWKQLKPCITYMSVFERVIRNAIDPRLVSIVPCIEDERLDRTFSFLRRHIPKIVQDENHAIQTHLINLDYFEKTVLIRLKAHGITIEKIYVKRIKTDSGEIEYESMTEDDNEKGPSVVMYELTPDCAEDELEDDHYQHYPHPTDPEYEPGNINIFKLNHKTTVTFDDILSSIHTDAKFPKK